MIGLATAMFLVILDAAMVNLAGSAIRRGLGLIAAELTVVVDSYLVTFAGLLLLADVLGARRVFLTGMAVYLAASAFCALATGGGMLIAGRIGQGIGAAVLMPAATTMDTSLLTPLPEAAGEETGVASADEIDQQANTFSVDSIEVGHPYPGKVLGRNVLFSAHDRALRERARVRTRLDDTRRGPPGQHRPRRDRDRRRGAGPRARPGRDVDRSRPGDGTAGAHPACRGRRSGDLPRHPGERPHRTPFRCFCWWLFMVTGERVPFTDSRVAEPARHQGVDVSLRIQGLHGRAAGAEKNMVAVYVSRDDIRDLDAGELGGRIAAAAGVPRAGAATAIAEFEPAPRYTIQDVLLGHITWDELTRASA